MKTLDDSTPMEIIERYVWFIQRGWSETVLNDPIVITYLNGTSTKVPTPQYIDTLIQEGMERWPIHEQREAA
jgi:hypothetical protein